MNLFSIFADHTFRVVAAGAGILGLLCGVIGTFAVSRRRSLMGDGISHACLPGVVAVFLIFGVKDVPLLLLGALCAGLLASGTILIITGRSKLKLDAALALVMSLYFGLGTVLLTLAQKLENSNQAGLDRFIFGQVSALLPQDVVMMLVAGAILLTLVILFNKEIEMICFDRDFAQTSGFPVKLLEAGLELMTVVCIILGLETVGVILSSALLTAPAVAARQWSNRFSVVTVLSGIIGAFSGIAGAYMSEAAPDMPTGPAIVIVVSVIVIISLLTAPGRGIIAKLLVRRRLRKQTEKAGA